MKNKIIQDSVLNQKENSFLLKMISCSRPATSEEEKEIAVILNSLSEEDLELTDETDELDL